MNRTCASQNKNFVNQIWCFHQEYLNGQVYISLNRHSLLASRCIQQQGLSSRLDVWKELNNQGERETITGNARPTALAVFGLMQQNCLVSPKMPQLQAAQVLWLIETQAEHIQSSDIVIPVSLSQSSQKYFSNIYIDLSTVIFVSTNHQ